MAEFYVKLFALIKGGVKFIKCFKAGVMYRSLGTSSLGDHA